MKEQGKDKDDYKKEHHEDGLTKTIARYASSRLYEQFISLLNAFIRPRLLIPELYGLWHTLLTIPGYAVYSNLGIHTAMRYSVPYHESRNEHEKVKEIQSSVVYGSLATKLTIALVLIVIAIFAEMSLKVRVGLLTMACLVVLEWYFNYYIASLEAFNQFIIISRVNYLKTTLAFIGSVFLIYFFNIYGVYVSAVLTLGIIIFYMRAKYPLRPGIKFSRSVLTDLVKQGFPIMLFNMCTDLISQSDKVIIAAFLGTEQVGYYAIAVMIHHFVMNIPVAVRAINETRLMRGLSSHSKEDTLNEFFFKPLIITAYFMPFLVGSVIFFLPVFIPLVLPRYTPGIIPAQILAFGCYFFALFFVTRGIIVANHWQIKASILMFSVFFIHIGLIIILLILGFGIIGVSVGFSISLFLLFLCIFTFLMKKLDIDKITLKENISAISRPLLVMATAIFLLSYTAHLLSANAYLMAFLQLCLYNGCMFIVLKLSQERLPFLKGFRLKNL